jgi:hypothetical protein
MLFARPGFGDGCFDVVFLKFDGLPFACDDEFGCELRDFFGRFCVSLQDCFDFLSTSDFVSSIAREEKPRRDKVADVMSDSILVCRDKTPLTSAARTMTQAGWRSVLVVNSMVHHWA